jgi:alpha-mannosidase
MTMFFDEIMRQADPAKIKTFAKDSNNQWADQDATDAWLLALARRQGEAIPTAEKFATIATTLVGGGYPWTDIYQAYHRVLQYHEHTDAIDFIDCDPERMRQYETELEEDREMVSESKEFSDRTCATALDKLAGLITTKAEQSIIVFNPLAHIRTDVVRLATGLAPRFKLRDAVTGKDVPYQTLPEGTIGFVASDVPSLGYKTFSLLTPTRSVPRSSPCEGRARLPPSERAVGVCPDRHVFYSFSSMRRARRDVPYHRAAWARKWFLPHCL